MRERFTTEPRPRHAVGALLLTLAISLTVALFGSGAARAGSAGLSQLNAQLGANQATQASLAADLKSLENQIGALQQQITLVRSREAEVAAALGNDRRTLARVDANLTRQRARLARLRRILGRAQLILSRQLVSSYEQPQRSLVSVMLESDGFTQMLDQLQDLQTAEHSQQRIITFTAEAKAATVAATRRLGALQDQARAQTTAATVQAHALSGMQGLLDGRQRALADIRSARSTALANARSRGNALRSAIATIRAQQAAAAAAAAAAARAAQAAAAAAAARAAQAAQRQSQTQSQTQSPGATPAAAAPTATPSGGWAIPAAVVMCESGGQNLPPNSAGASGYYQIMPATWKGEGGSGPAAYLAPKSEQDAIAARLWNGGAGASNWVCAGIVGIS